MPGNVATVWVCGVEVDRYYELDDDAEFTFETDSGAHYRVVLAETRRFSRSWVVLIEQADGHERRVGNVTRGGFRNQYNYRYEKPRPGFFNRGGQHDLLNAVQCLTE